MLAKSTFFQAGLRLETCRGTFPQGSSCMSLPKKTAYMEQFGDYLAILDSRNLIQYLVYTEQ